MGAYFLLDNGPNFCTSLPQFGWVILFHLARFHNFESYIGMCNLLINPLKKKKPSIVLISSGNLLMGQLLNLNQNNLSIYCNTYQLEFCNYKLFILFKAYL